MPGDAGSVKEAFPTIGALEGLLHHLASLFFRRGGEFNPFVGGLDFSSHETCSAALGRVSAIGTPGAGGVFRGDRLMGNRDVAEVFHCRIKTHGGRLSGTRFFMNFRSW